MDETTSTPACACGYGLNDQAQAWGVRGAFAQRGEFPNPDMVSLPLSTAAKRYYERGPSPLWRFLPFRLSTLVDRFIWVAASVASAALALFGLLSEVTEFPLQPRQPHPILAAGKCGESDGAEH